MAFAERTTVAVSKSQDEIRRLVTKHKATHFGLMEEPDAMHVVFRLAERNIRFTMPAPPAAKSSAEANRREKVLRSRWRALLLIIKARIEGVESGIETFEEAFFSHIVMPGGETVYEQMREPLRLRYEQNSNIPLLQGPK